MPNFVLAYRGGGGAPDSPEEGEKVMAAWMNWFGALGEAVVDGGAPFMGGAATIASDGKSSNGGSAALSGYSIISADDLDDAVAKAKGCPVLEGGGTVDVYESSPIG